MNMANRFMAVVVLFALFSLTTTSGRAQDMATQIVRAQKTLADISRLLDAVAARQASHASIKRTAPDAGGWTSLFDGETLNGWQITAFTGGGQAHVVKSFRGGPPAIVVDAGASLSGINWTKQAPKTNYEISLEAMKIEGDDFMCGLTFPVGDSHASLILGGWGGTVVGISSIDGQDASENETSQTVEFPKDRWFAIRVRVTPATLVVWLDEKKIVDVSILDKKIGLRFGEISKSVPLGLATYRTSAAYRNIKIRPINAK